MGSDGETKLNRHKSEKVESVRSPDTTSNKDVGSKMQVSETIVRGREMARTMRNLLRVGVCGEARSGAVFTSCLCREV